jgi:diguanylate cyclase (GGDEF)-like protein
MAKHKAGGATVAGKGKALVVDDSRLVRAVITRYLRAGGYQTDEADNGAAALKQIAEESYDVVISDLRMPELNGLELLAAVKRLSPDLEVIILTGTHSQDMSSAIQALRLGAHDYLTKPPASADEVVMTVDRAVEKKRLKESNQRLLRELEAMSRTDALTQVPNRRAFDQALPREVSRARRHGLGLSLLVLDIDHFKKVNDSVGHQGGDEILKGFARLVSTTLRECEVVYRFGGEEFVVILPHTDAAGARKAAERIVAAVSEKPMPAAGTSLAITTSVGVACLGPEDEAGEAVLARADAAVYEAKRSGRNRVVVAKAPGRLALVSRAGWAMRGAAPPRRPPACTRRACTGSCAG